MTRRSVRVLAAAAGTGLALGGVAVGGAVGATSEGGGWTVDTGDCPDEAADTPIEGEIFIASAMPRSGGVAAAAFEPAAQGLETYIAYANEKGLLDGVNIKLTVGDDQYNPALTPGVVEGLLDEGAQVVTGLIGTGGALAVRDLLNEECVPMLNLLTGDPRWGDEVGDYPWTTGLLTAYHHEFRGYAESIAAEFPDQTIGTFAVNNEFGQVSLDAFNEAAGEAGLEIVEEQTVEGGDESPPASQVAALADAEVGVIVAVPLGAQCISFLNALAEEKAARAGWEPVVYLTNTCGASSLIMGVAGASADGIYSSASMGIVDVANPEIQSADPAVAEYVQYMTDAGKGDIITTGAAGWMVGEVTVEILRQAQASPEGLTQASIINAARNLNYQPSLLREGMSYIMNGEDDGYYSEDVQIIQYAADTVTFTDIGTPFSYESSPDLVGQGTAAAGGDGTAPAGSEPETTG